MECSSRSNDLTARDLAHKQNIDVPPGPHRCAYSKDHGSGHRWYNSVSQWRYPFWIFDDDGYLIISSEEDLRRRSGFVITSGFSARTARNFARFWLHSIPVVIEAWWKTYSPIMQTFRQKERGLGSDVHLTKLDFTWARRAIFQAKFRTIGGKLAEIGV